MIHYSPEADVSQIMDAADQFEKIVQHNIDTERFDEVPEHHGNIKRLIERYGDNPGTCPYIKSMGQAGIELVQKLAAAESNPERGPTMRELMDAKKKQSQENKVTVKRANKDVGETESKIVESKLETKPAETTQRTNIAKASTAFEQTECIIEDTLTATKVIKNKSTELAIQAAPEQPQQVIAKPLLDVVAALQTIDLDIQSPEAVRTQEPLKVIAKDEVTVVHAYEHAIHTEGRNKEEIPQLQVKPESSVVDFAKPIIVGRIDQYGAIAETDPVTLVAEGDEFDFEKPLVELGLPDFMPEATNLIEAENPEEITLTEFGIDTESVLVNIDSDLTIEASVDMTLPNEALTEDMVPQETITPIELQDELSEYIQLLEPSIAESAQATLDELVEAIHINKEYLEQDPGDVIIPLAKIEQLVIKLLETLSLNHDEKVVKPIIKTLLTPELLKILQKGEDLSIEQLNYIGTHEYTPNPITYIFSSILRMIKDKVDPLLLIGKYALSASLA